MCIHQITVPTRSRVLSLIHRQPLLHTVPCGRCCECQQQKFNEWYYRIYHEWLDCIENNGYVYFTTLTYDDAHLPHLSDFMDIERGSELDYSCFSRVDLRGFVTRLSERLRYDYDMDSSVFRRFIAAEYGSDDEYIDDYGNLRVGTCRPHYHCLFFVHDDSLDVHDLYDMVFECWCKGRVDGVREYGEHSNVFRGNNQRSQLAVSNYVAKYVQKISSFQSEIDWRIDAYMSRFEHEYFDTCIVTKSELDIDSFVHRFTKEIDFDYDESVKFWKSQTYKREKSRLSRCVSQFHLQNKGFGACALRDIDLNEVIENGFFIMPDCQSVVRKLPIPKYYERKMFEELVNVNGYRVWQKTSLGLLYQRKKQSRLISRLVDKFTNVNDTYHLGLSVDFTALAQYVVCYKGRMNGNLSNDIQLSDLVKLPSNFLVYNYSCPTDKALFHESFVTRDFNGCQSEYFSSCLDDAVPLSVFLKSHLIDDNFLPSFKGFDSALEKIYQALEIVGNEKQSLFDFKQEFHNKHRQSSLLPIV